MEQVTSMQSLIFPPRRNFIKKGKNIQDDYQILREAPIGKGTYGMVWRAKHKLTEQLRAIKLIPIMDVRDLNMLEQEVEIMMIADHPNVINLYEWYEDDKYIQLVMELCHGKELYDRIAGGRIFSEKRAADMFKMMLSAINYLHTKGIVHRDLKPENFLFQNEKEDSSIKLIDFGLSKLLTNKISKMKTTTGSPYYIAPEVINGEYDFRCDIWSLGVILHIMLCGYPPFNGNDEHEIIESVKVGRFDFDEIDWKAISSSAKDLIVRMITKPESRISLEEALEHPWIKVFSCKLTVGLDDKYLQRITGFKGQSKLKKLVLFFMATQLAHSECSIIVKMFNTMDKNNDGKLSLEELKEGIKEFKTPEEAQGILEGIDLDKNGYIDYNEFVAATLDKQIYLDEGWLRTAFNLFDRDKNGKISADELKETIGANMDLDLNYWSKLIKGGNLNQNGEINFDDFSRLMFE